jgi:hypothetical protein
MAELDDRRWIEDMAVACTIAAMCGMPIWPPLPRPATRKDRDRSVQPDRRSLIARVTPMLKALLPRATSHR